MTHRLELIPWRSAMVLAGLLAAVLGVLSAARPALAVELALALPFAAIVFSDLALGVGLFLISQFLAPNTGSLAKVAGVLLLIAAVTVDPSSRLRARRPSLLSADPVLCLLILGSVAWVALSVGWATSGSVAAANALRYALDATLFVVVFAAVRTRRDAGVIVGSFVVGAALAAAYGIVGSSNLTQPGRLVGATGEANELATYLVAGLLLSVALVAEHRRRPVLAWGAAACGAMCAAGIALTLSRAALVALAVALFAALVVVRRHRAVIAPAAVLLVGAFLVYFLAFAPPSARQRIFNDPGGTSGRTALWTVGWRMVQSDPIAGVGIGNFPLRSVDFLVRPGAVGNDTYVIGSETLEAHNIYLQLLAETGIVGLLLFAAVVGRALWGGWRAARARGPDIDPGTRLLAEATLVATVSVLVANFFAPGLFDKQMWLLFALGPVLAALAAPAGTRA